MEAVLWSAFGVFAAFCTYAVIWSRNHGDDGHRHDWGPGWAVLACGKAYRTCGVCGFREWEVSG